MIAIILFTIYEDISAPCHVCSNTVSLTSSISHLVLTKLRVQVYRWMDWHKYWTTHCPWNVDWCYQNSLFNYLFVLLLSNIWNHHHVQYHSKEELYIILLWILIWMLLLLFIYFADGLTHLNFTKPPTSNTFTNFASIGGNLHTANLFGSAMSSSLGSGPPPYWEACMTTYWKTTVMIVWYPVHVYCSCFGPTDYLQTIGLLV